MTGSFRRPFTLFFPAGELPAERSLDARIGSMVLSVDLVRAASIEGIEYSGPSLFANLRRPVQLSEERLVKYDLNGFHHMSMRHSMDQS